MSPPPPPVKLMPAPAAVSTGSNAFSQMNDRTRGFLNTNRIGEGGGTVKIAPLPPLSANNMKLAYTPIPFGLM